jgi:soluble lytic murein transglycosylase-like protein
MVLRLQGWPPAWRGRGRPLGALTGAARRGILLRRLLLLGALIAEHVCAPCAAHAAGVIATTATSHAHRASGVVMLIGGMTSDMSIVNDSAPQSLQRPASSINLIAASDDPGPCSVVIQPGRSSLTDAIEPTSAAVVARVMALLPVIDEAAHATDLDSALLMAVIEVESGGNPQAVSPKGATGLMQLMPLTGERHGASNLFDPRQNVVAGARYLKELTRRFGDLPLALAAYNAGEAAVQNYGGQIPPYEETVRYVPKVIARYTWYRAAMASINGTSMREGAESAKGRVLLIHSESRR